MSLKRIFSKTKQTTEQFDEVDHTDHYVFQIRLGVVSIACVLNVIIPIFNTHYHIKLMVFEILMQIFYFYILYSKQNTFIIAFSSQVILLTPLLYLSFNVDDSIRIPILAIGFIAVYCLQFFAIAINFIFAGLAFLVVINSSYHVHGSFDEENAIIRLLKTISLAWPIITFMLFLIINTFQYFNDKIWKSYSRAKAKLRSQNQELQLKNDQLNAMIQKLKVSKIQLETANKNLSEALKSQDLFVACVSHELRNPLNALMGNIELLLSNCLDENTRKSLKACQTCGEMLLVLINNILDVSKIHANSLEINISTINMSHLIEKIWSVSIIGIQQKNLYGKLKVSKNLPLWVKGDSQRLIQIILNIIGNATKFTARGGIEVIMDWEESLVHQSESDRTTQSDREINEADLTKSSHRGILSPDDHHERKIIEVPRIEQKFHFFKELNNPHYFIFTEKDPNLSSLFDKLEFESGKTGILRIQVSDTGCGIPLEAQEKIFDAFVQADPSITRKYEGSGLGLYIVKQLLQKMNGTISLKSEVNQGTNFIIQVPLKTVFGQEVFYIKRTKSLGKINLKKETRHRVLIVDDSHYNQNILKTYLEKLNLKTDLADNGLEALNKFETHPIGYYSLITMDIQMPEMDGISASKHIRMHEKKMNASKETPLIVITGNCTESEQKLCLDPDGDIRATYFFRKPFLFTDCKICVENIFLQNGKQSSGRQDVNF